MRRPAAEPGGEAGVPASPRAPAYSRGAGSAVYDHMHAVIGDVMAEMVAHLRRDLYESAEAAKRLARQHREILEAVKKGDGAEARKLITQHLKRALADYEVSQ